MIMRCRAGVPRHLLDSQIAMHGVPPGVIGPSLIDASAICYRFCWLAAAQGWALRTLIHQWRIACILLCGGAVNPTTKRFTCTTLEG